MLLTRFRRVPVLLALALAALSTGCANDDRPSADPPVGTPEPPSVRSVDDPEPRLAVTYDGGVRVLDATDGEVLLDEALDGFLRVNPAGDGRHFLVSRPGGFTLLDLGAWTVDHGDHEHSYADDPALLDGTLPAEEPGHVVAHHGWTTLFDDGTGTMTSFETHDLDDPEELETETATTADPHHGVAARTHDGGWVRTVGTSEQRNGVEVVSSDGEVLAASDACPGVHGEAFARDVAVFGCEDGALVVDGTDIAKVRAPDAYGRIGNQAGHEDSPYVLGDYKTDPEAELERPTRVSVIDSRSASLRLVDLGTSYSFRSLGRTPDGDGLVLGTDGALHVVDVRRAQVSASLPVVARWREPLDWEQPRPTLEVVGDTAYVTEPATRQLHVVDLATMTVTDSHTLAVTPDEVVGVTG
ncbi:MULTISPECIES: zinc metallochaperone AztD [unclassified Nocardioides]|uniref:zinc metallochaperone AztD n=1 Tax=unclassified Nocardioides TaxID=2615069 RepID=UPI00360CAAEA